MKCDKCGADLAIATCLVDLGEGGVEVEITACMNCKKWLDVTIDGLEEDDDRF